jgi:hypothetical protein
MIFMEPRQRQVPFVAPVFAKALAPVTETISRIITGPVAEVPCRQCGGTCALWAQNTRLLYRPGGAGQLGPPLSTNDRENVLVGCGHCGHRHRPISGRAVGRNRHNGRPLLR